MKRVSPIHKEVNRFMWIIKGQLVPDGYSERDYVEIHDSYFKRIWGNHEAPTHEDGFEEAYNKKYRE
tara:strand:- start:568 stop:768 length:201 start_codon:yes stop_codon:yes gene_type:complete